MTMALRIRGLRRGLLALGMLGLMAPLAVPAQARDTDSKATTATVREHRTRAEMAAKKLASPRVAEMSAKKIERLQRLAASVTVVAPASNNVKQMKVAKSEKGDDD